MSEAVREIIYRDHFEECMAHFVRAFDEVYPPGSRNRLKSGAQPIADFVGVDLNTVGAWLSSGQNTRKIIGESWVKMLCFLDLNGYRVIEFERLPTAVRNLAELIGYGVVTAVRATSEVGFTESSEFYAVMRERRGLSKEREDRMWAYWKTSREQLERKKRDAARKYAVDLHRQSALTSSVAVSNTAQLSGTSQTSGHRTAALHLMHGLRVLLDEGIFENLSESEAEEMPPQDKVCIAQIAAHMSVLGVRLMTGKKV